MGVTTDFIGHVDINPGLNDAEQAYLAAFSSSRRCRRPGGPYAVPGNPAAEGGRKPSRRDLVEAEEAERLPIDDSNSTAEGQPSLWCQWEICWDGCCLTYNGVEKFYGSTAWLDYLIDHFLRPGALASASGLAYFSDFTFDHHLDGVIAASRRSDKRMTLIRVTDNVVTEELIRPGDRRYQDQELLAYEAFLNREWEESAVRRRPQPRRGRKAARPTP